MLSADALRGQIRPLFDPDTMPGPDPVLAWTKAYSAYAQTVLAGPVALAAPLAPVGGDGQFFDALEAALRSMWMTAAWVGPGVTASTTSVPPLRPLLDSLSPEIISSYDRELAPSLIAEAIHTYTLSIVVTVVPSSGTPFTANLA